MIKKRMYFLVLIILALFCLVNCSKDSNSSESGENIFKESEALKKPIDFSTLTFNEAQQKLIDIYTSDFPKDMEIIKGYEAIDRKVQHYHRKTKDGEIIGKSGTKATYLKKGTKEVFTGKVMHNFIGHSDEYIKDGVAVLNIRYGNGTHFGFDNCLDLLSELDVNDDKLNQVSYSFQITRINENYAKENGITLNEDGECPSLNISEKVNDIVVKITYYFYDLNSKKYITKYEEILTENLEYLKNTEMVYE